MHLYFPVYSLFLALPICIRPAISSFGPRKYVLSRDCISMPTALVELEESPTKTLRIDDLENSAVIYSHDFESDFESNVSSSRILGENYYAQYPLGFACEVVVHAPIENGRIMLSIESFFIPSSDQTCKDDFLYVFDSNTARSKAMPEAGGEQGLCLSRYPKVPVFSSKSYICIAFHSSNSPRSQLLANAAVTPGFKIIVTAFQESQSYACPEGRFYCGSVATTAATALSIGGGTVPDFHTGGRSAVRLPSMGICVSERVRCDGVVNCPDGRDEFPSLCSRFQSGIDLDSDNGFFGNFLSLGLTTTVTIVVAGALFVMLCLGCVICYCYCRKRSNSNDLNPINDTGITVFNGANRPLSGDVGGHHIDPSRLINGMHKSPEAFQTQVLQRQQQQQQQMIMSPAKSMGDLFNLQQQQQLSPKFPMTRHLQNQQAQPTPPVWDMQPLCCPPPPTQPHQPQWYSQSQQQQMPAQNHQPMAMPPQNQPTRHPLNRISDPKKINLPTNDSHCFIGSPSPTSALPCPPPPVAVQQQQVPAVSPQQLPIHSNRFDSYQHLNSPPDNSHLIADGGIVYLGEIGGGAGSGSNGSRLASSRDPRRPRRRSGRTVDTQSSSSFGGGPSTRGAQSAEGAPRTASNSSHSIGPSWSSSRGTAANNPNGANSSSAARPHHHHHHHHRRRRHGGTGGGGSSGKQSNRNLSATSSVEKIAFPVEL